MENSKDIAIVGGGPAGLMAAEILAKAGHKVTVYDRMPTLGRKFLMAGRGGLNLTHSESFDSFIKRYGAAADWLAPHIKAFTPVDLCLWCEDLGEKTFIGTSKRVFPKSMKTSPLLRAWLGRLEKLGVAYVAQHTWQGWESDALKFLNAKQETVLIKPDATLLALGGASWPRLGSDGGWVKILSDNGVEIAPLRPANCGFMVKWSEHLTSKFAGTPLKPVSITHDGISLQGEMMVTADGIEGGAVYGMSSQLREAIAKDGSTVIHLDVRPDMSVEALTRKLSASRGSQSFNNYLRKAGLSPVVISLLNEVTPRDQLPKLTPDALAVKLKALPITLTGTKDIARAISTAGGIKQNALTDDFMLKNKPGVFAAGEMLDWEAPTGGYLLQACFSTAVAAANGILKY